MIAMIAASVVAAATRISVVIAVIAASVVAVAIISVITTAVSK